MSRQRKHKRRVYASIRRRNAVQWLDEMRDAFSACSFDQSTVTP
jgi:hypothetical protein